MRPSLAAVVLSFFSLPSSSSLSVASIACFFPSVASPADLLVSVAVVVVGVAPSSVSSAVEVAVVVVAVGVVVAVVVYVVVVVVVVVIVVVVRSPCVVIDEEDSVGRRLA